ncbi:hypothetical protein BGX23_001074 [Mortierella sp. AD031]|nr:hypothetical protein BGX23_001074 [Mortierella sp. AD031]
MVSPSPLEIPEILEQILSYLDDTTIQQSAIYLNKIWFLLARPRINQELVFDNGRRRADFYRVMPRIPEVSRLWWRTEYGRDRKNQWLELVRLLRVKDLRYRRRMQGGSEEVVSMEREYDFGRRRRGRGRGKDISTSNTTFSTNNSNSNNDKNDTGAGWTMLERPLLELRLGGFMDLMIRMEPLLPLMGFLTVLKLVMRRDTAIDIRAILTASPDLQVLHIRSTSTVRMLGRWLPKGFQKTSLSPTSQEQEQEQDEQEQPSSRSSQKVLRLRELVLERTFFYQSSLEELLSFTPHLDTLRLIDLKQQNWLMSRVTLTYDLQSLLTHLKSPSLLTLPRLPLQSFTFSIASFNTPEQDIQRAVTELCPGSQECTVYAEDLSMPMLKYLREEVPNVVTMLELWYTGVRHFSPDPVLHRYLCSSPHLIHLKAPRSNYLVNHIDIHRRMDAVSAGAPRGGGGGQGNGSRQRTNSLIGPPGIWACKNLQTLHLSFRSTAADHTTAIATAIATTRATTTTVSSAALVIETSKTHSRIVFGYISRVCPNLRDVSIHVSENYYWVPHATRRKLTLTLDSGFCLLARLKHLETLRVRAHVAEDFFTLKKSGGGMAWGDLEPVDLDWMLDEAHGHTDVGRRSREERRRAVERWEGSLGDESVGELETAMRSQWWDRNKATTATTTTTPMTISTPPKTLENRPQQILRGRTDPEIHAELKDLGLLVDVKNMLEEMDQQGGEEGQEPFRCWPMLRWMRVYQTTEYGRSREREIKRLLTRPKEPKSKHKV